MPDQTCSRLDALRAEGRARFQELGWPTPKHEAWRFTNLAALARLPFQTVAAARPGPVTLPPPLVAGAHRLVLVDGRFRPELSELGDLPPGVVLTGLADAVIRHPDLIESRLGRLAAVDGHAAIALNAAELSDGAVLVLPAGTRLERPVELVLTASANHETTNSGDADQPPLAWHPRLLILAGADSQATVIEHHLSPGRGPSLANMVTEASLGAGARLRHYQVRQGQVRTGQVRQGQVRQGQVGRDDDAGFALTTVTARLERQADYQAFLLILGGRLTRTELRVVLDGPGATAHLNGAYLLRGHSHSDIVTLVDHAKPDGTSRQLFKGVIDQHGRGVFQGKVLVRPGADRTDGHQLHRALLLSDDAEIDAKPELEIFADDVKCSHGATVGDLDEEALFYLRARGIDRDGARALLIGAYVREAIAEIADEAVREAFDALADRWLNNG